MSEGGVDLDAVKGGMATSSVDGGAVLNDYVEAVVGGQDSEAPRERVRDSLGPEATVDAAAVIANFSMMVRIADGAGIALDDMLQVVTQGVQEKLALKDFAASANTPTRGRGFQLLSRVVTPIAQRAFPLVSRLAACSGRTR